MRDTLGDDGKCPVQAVFFNKEPYCRCPHHRCRYCSGEAILVERDGKPACVKLIRETKSSVSSEDLRGREQAAIACGAAHFDALGIDYAVATGPASLRLEG